jgi:hypothetical protein
VSDLRKAAEQMLECLLYHYNAGNSNTITGVRLKLDEKAIREARTALAAPEPEPVPESKTPAWWINGLAVTLMREGVNKHRAREIAQGYWEAYCQIPETEDAAIDAAMQEDKA